MLLCFDDKSLQRFDSVWTLTLTTALLPYEYKFLCFFLHLYSTGFWKQCVKKLDMVHFVVNQSLCVCLRWNDISQALNFSLWMSRSSSHMVSSSVYCRLPVQHELVLVMFTPTRRGAANFLNIIEVVVPVKYELRWFTCANMWRSLKYCSFIY